ncbi:hypothetical protein, partial [uncultured Muribaculum sp.]|uniref:hypothetical protein n=1 Tax=uncultured Muribaculum sp. TaxID=1918613 RepID=UPI00259C92C1
GFFYVVALTLVIKHPLKFFIFFFFVEEVTPRAIVMHLRPLVSVTMQPHCSLTARTHLHNA